LWAQTLRHILYSPVIFVRKQLLFLLLIVCINNGYAQDSTRVKNRLTETITEHFFVLNADKSTKTGRYTAQYRHHIPLASGSYTNNRKTGTWHFYDPDGSLIESFNYDKNTLMYEKPGDSISDQQIGYSFDDSIKVTDHVTKPIKPGGRYYGYLPYLRIFKLSDDYNNTDPGLFTAVLELLVSPGGRLADFKVHITSDDSERITTFSTELIDNEDKIFFPATINGKPVISTIFVKCRLTLDGELDVYE